MDNKGLYCFCSWNANNSELTTEFGTEKKMRAKYIEFVMQFVREYVMGYTREQGRNCSYADLLADDNFVFLGDEGVYRAKLIKVEG